MQMIGLGAYVIKLIKYFEEDAEGNNNLCHLQLSLVSSPA